MRICVNDTRIGRACARSRVGARIQRLNVCVFSYLSMKLSESALFNSQLSVTILTVVSLYAPVHIADHFHVPCVDQWLHINQSCAVCRNNIDGSSNAPRPLAHDEHEHAHHGHSESVLASGTAMRPPPHDPTETGHTRESFPV